MREGLAIGLACLVLVGTFVVTLTQDVDPEQKTLKQAIGSIDQSIVALRHGNPEGARGHLRQAKGQYEALGAENLEEAFDSCIASPAEGNLRSLRGRVSKAGSLPLIYEHSIFFILLVSFLFALIVTLITKRVVDWPRVKQIKAEVGAWQRELRDAQRKRDMKRVHKLQLDQRRIFSLQGEVMRSSFKPMLFYFVPWLLLWVLLGRIYSGWVVAWLPFKIPLLFFGLWASCGFLSWLLVTYFGFSSLWRKVLIGD